MCEVRDHADRRRPEEVVALASDIYQTVFNETETFGGSDLGADLAYLLGAVVTDAKCEWPADREILELLKRSFQPDHRVWSFISVTDA